MRAKLQLPIGNRHFLEMLPAIQRNAQSAFAQLADEARQEATQAVVTSAAIAYANLVKAGKAHAGYATPLARYGVMQYRSGRLPGGSLNTSDVGSASWRHRGHQTTTIYGGEESVGDSRRADPTDLAALRVDFVAWCDALSGRDQQVVHHLAWANEQAWLHRFTG